MFRGSVLNLYCRISPWLLPDVADVTRQIAVVSRLLLLDQFSICYTLSHSGKRCLKQSSLWSTFQVAGITGHHARAVQSQCPGE